MATNRYNCNHDSGGMRSYAPANAKIQSTNLYREHPSPRALSAWLECSWSIEVATTAQDAPVRPDGCLDIVYSRSDGLRAVGAMTTEKRFDQIPESLLCGVRFRPGMARSFFGIPSGELTDNVIPLDDLFGRHARELERRLSDARSPSEAARLLAVSLPAPANAPNSVQRTIAALAATHGLADLDFFSRAANLSPRQFRRRCLEESGLTPKHLCRILRFRRALQLGSRHLKDWAGIAVETGYFDQAHLIRDFREFTGQTPMAVFSNPAPRRTA
jgi:AraC-like DNA-binding protein